MFMSIIMKKCNVWEVRVLTEKKVDIFQDMM